VHGVPALVAIEQAADPLPEARLVDEPE